jgi:hypothetical protein
MKGIAVIRMIYTVGHSIHVLSVYSVLGTCAFPHEVRLDYYHAHPDWAKQIDEVRTTEAHMTTLPLSEFT